MKGSRRGAFRGKVSHNASQQRSKATNYGHLVLPRGVNMFKEEPGGRIALDVLPYFVTDQHHPDRDDEREIAVPGSLWYRRPYKLHRSIGVNNTSVVCPSSVGKKCPICAHRAEQLAAGAKWDDEAIRAMRPSDRSLYYVVPRNSSKHEEKAYIWDIANFLFQDALNNELEENEEFGDFPDPEIGLTLHIRFSEEKFASNSFAKTSRIDFKARDYKYDEEKIIRPLGSLDDVLDIKDYKEVYRLFFETGDGDADEDVASDEDDAADDDDAEDDQPATRSVYRARTEPTAQAARLQRRTPEPEPDEEEEDDEPPFDRDDEEEEDEPPPARERPRRPVAEPAKPARTASPTVQRGAVPSAKAPAKPPKTPPAKPKGECPHGYRFGTDVDTKDECEDCEVWNECMEARDTTPRKRS